MTRVRARRLLAGRTLRDRLERRKQLPEGDVRIIARRLLEALADMADLGVCHMDVKPSHMGLTKLIKLETCTLFDMGSWRRTSETLPLACNDCPPHLQGSARSPSETSRGFATVAKGT